MHTAFLPGFRLQALDTLVIFHTLGQWRSAQSVFAVCSRILDWRNSIQSVKNLSDASWFSWSPLQVRFSMCHYAWDRGVLAAFVHPIARQALWFGTCVWPVWKILIMSDHFDHLFIWLKSFWIIWEWVWFNFSSVCMCGSDKTSSNAKLCHAVSCWLYLEGRPGQMAGKEDVAWTRGKNMLLQFRVCGSTLGKLDMMHSDDARICYWWYVQFAWHISYQRASPIDQPRARGQKRNFLQTDLIDFGQDRKKKWHLRRKEQCDDGTRIRPTYHFASLSQSCVVSWWMNH